MQEGKGIVVVGGTVEVDVVVDVELLCVVVDVLVGLVEEELVVGVVGVEAGVEEMGSVVVGVVAIDIGKVTTVALVSEAFVIFSSSRLVGHKGMILICKV